MRMPSFGRALPPPNGWEADRALFPHDSQARRQLLPAASTLSAQSAFVPPPRRPLPALLPPRGWEADYPLFTTVNRIVNGLAQASDITNFQEVRAGPTAPRPRQTATRLWSGAA
jgi:hypothetical protein